MISKALVSSNVLLRLDHFLAANTVALNGTSNVKVVPVNALTTKLSAKLDGTKPNNITRRRRRILFSFNY
jgi:hypothetical protein